MGEFVVKCSLDVNIFSALSAQDGIEILMKEDIDLILTDVQMPEIDGFEFVEYLKNIERTKDIPVIFITGIYDKDEYKTKGYDLGAIEYITKPIHDVLLNSKLTVLTPIDFILFFVVRYYYGCLLMINCFLFIGLNFYLPC